MSKVTVSDIQVFGFLALGAGALFILYRAGSWVADRAEDANAIIQAPTQAVVNAGSAAVVATGSGVASGARSVQRIAPHSGVGVLQSVADAGAYAAGAVVNGVRSLLGLRSDVPGSSEPGYSPDPVIDSPYDPFRRGGPIEGSGD